MNQGETTIGILCKLYINCYLVKPGDREYCFNLGGGGGKGWNSNTVVKLLFESYLISTKGLNTHYSSAFKLWSH